MRRNMFAFVIFVWLAAIILILIFPPTRKSFIPHGAVGDHVGCGEGGKSCVKGQGRNQKKSQPNQPDMVGTYGAEMADRIPSYRSNTMARLGTDLNFDTRQNCPAGSYMLNRSPEFSAKHPDCPTLFIVGARKGGSSSLYVYVSKHPDFNGVKLDGDLQVGELFYFHKKRLGSWKNYISNFPTGGVMSGESSVAYLVGDLVPKRLYETCGTKAKVVMLLRDPVRRFESNFLMRTRSRLSLRNQTISPVLKHELDHYLTAAMKKSPKIPHDWHELVGIFQPAQNMVFEGVYYVHLLNWLCNFPAENILIINSQEFFQNPGKILDLVFQFLGLKSLDSETYEQITSTTYNKGRYSVPSYQKLSYTDIAKLLQVYQPFNKALFELLQWDNHGWLS